jgi:hypothetical protein
MGSVLIVVYLGFDKVFLDLIATIKTDQDRLDAITELQSFIVRITDFDCSVV